MLRVKQTTVFCMAALAFSCAIQVAHAASGDTIKSPEQVKAAEADALFSRVSAYGTVLERRPLNVGGLTAWLVEKGAGKVVLYTTADGTALFSGVVWDAQSGHNLSEQIAWGKAPNTLPLTAEPREVRTAAAFDGEFSDPIPESMKTVDALAGVKEGKGGIADTLYIIIDPRCPYCRTAYNNSRDYVQKGRSIKWIPTLALGDPAGGLPLAATILQSQDSLERVLGKHEPIRTQPTEESESALRTNLAFMFAAFEQNGGQQPGVPVAFFIDRRTGKPRMLTGVSERVVLEDIFGKL